MAFDYKKEYKAFYLPPAKPQIVTIPPMQYLSVAGQGDPNAPDGAYHDSIGLLYGIAFTIKMSARCNHAIAGFFDYVVPPLEGFWWQDGVAGIDTSRKGDYQWFSLIRLPDFVSSDDVQWAIAEATRKKKTDFSKVELLFYEEGLCVQSMHLGSFDEEPKTVTAMHEYAAQQGYVPDISSKRYHHEIYLSDARKVPAERLRTVVRHPIRPAECK